ncbi:hypothetical protein HDC92_004330 [Pedobacter sp. AK017]|uniref:hypothetical protein n=1 Tax=Pedobacter sp. AK017 TaxID=2723073 RepID=UPI0016093863|nr:hypothetical protein [Pedobacter sp. AK017]MBB5440627.1 hypothetical protein [Pedobacter sp. AK017]
MTHKELARLLISVTRTSVQNVCPDNPEQNSALTKAEAYRRFGRSYVDRWIKEGLIVLISANGKTTKKCIDKNQLEAIAAASNRISYLPVRER